LFALTWLRLGSNYWAGLVSVTVATALVVGIWERGQWPLGLFVAPTLAARELIIGVIWGGSLIVTCALSIASSADISYAEGRGFPWLELVTIYVPAVLHEELLFRGYPFQKLLKRNRTFAYLFVALVFAVLHSGNNGVTLLALVNVFLGGILLGFAYELHHRLWFPIGLHLAWNLMTGPILGDQVSGYTGEASVLVEQGGGAWWLTGGNFGIEGSVWMTVIELAAIAMIARPHMIRSKEQTT
jgi:membrane protease YdiL (CAAX protease family)